MIHDVGDGDPRDGRRAAAITAATALLLAVALAPAAPAQTDASPPVEDWPAPERRVEGGPLVSERDPAIEVRMPEEARYLGARRIPIDGRFDAELHVFAEADAYGLIERLCWIQFERHLPNAPGRYDYPESNPETVLFDGVEMHMRPGGENTQTATIQPGSDHAAFRALVDGAELRLPRWLSTLRLVLLFEPTERREFIVFYGEGPDALAEAAAQAMIAGEPGLTFEAMLPELVADVDRRVDLVPRGEAAGD